MRTAAHRRTMRCAVARSGCDIRSSRLTASTDDEAQRLLKAITRLQKSLGSNQDAHVAAGRFHAMVSSRGRRLPPETSFWIGVLAERHRSAAADARRGVRKRYAKLRGRRWKALQHAMNELSVAHAAPPSRARRPTGQPGGVLTRRSGRYRDRRRWTDDPRSSCAAGRARSPTSRGTGCTAATSPAFPPRPADRRASRCCRSIGCCTPNGSRTRRRSSSSVHRSAPGAWRRSRNPSPSPRSTVCSMPTCTSSATRRRPTPLEVSRACRRLAARGARRG